MLRICSRCCAFLICISLFCISPLLSNALADVFIPIPDSEKPSYHFDLARWFYADEQARQTDLRHLETLKARILALKPKAAEDPVKLFEAIELKQQMGIVADRVQAYGGLRYAINTDDIVVKDEGEAARSDFDATTQFVSFLVQDLDDATLKDFLAKEPRLESYAYLIESWRRNRPHTGPEAAEELLAGLQTHIDPFRAKFYDLMLARTPDATITVGDKQLNVMKAGDFGVSLRLDDRDIRELAFQKRVAGFKVQADLYAYTLFNKVLLANSVEESHHFANAIEAALFDSYQTPEMLDIVLHSFRQRASLAIRFQKAERVYQQKLLHLQVAQPWDLKARPNDIPEPRFTIGDASKNVIKATEIFGPKYQAELNNLLNPKNGRLDIVPGENRRNGDFTWGSYGPSWVFYMQGYNGYITDVVTLAHESAHAVHYGLLYKAGVPWYYSDGARYFTEGLAKVNELLILEHLAKTTKTPADRLFYLRELNSKLASVEFAAMYWAAFATSFETEVYRRVKSGLLKTPDEIHEVWAEFGRLWMLGFDQHPDLKYTWAGTPHFFGASRYYSNYLFAWVFSALVYERLQTDPSFPDKLVQLMETGFSAEPAKLLQTKLGIDLADSDALDRIFVVVEKRLEEFERAVEAQ